MCAVEISLFFEIATALHALVYTPFKGSLIQLSGPLLFLDCRVSPYARTPRLIEEGSTLALVYQFFDSALANEAIHVDCSLLTDTECSIHSLQVVRGI